MSKNGVPIRTARQPEVPIHVTGIELERNAEGNWTLGNLIVSGTVDNAFWLVVGVRLVSSTGAEASFTLTRDQFMNPGKVRGDLMHCPITARLDRGEIAEIDIAIEYLGILDGKAVGSQAGAIQTRLQDRYRPLMDNMRRIRPLLDGATPKQVGELIGKGDDTAPLHAAYASGGLSALLQVMERAERSYRALTLP